MDKTKLVTKVILDSKENGIVAKGYLEVVRSIQQRKAKLVVITKDVNNQNLVTEIKRMCNKYETPFISVLDKTTLGKNVGLDIDTGFASIKVSGFSKGDFKDLLDFVAKA